MAKRSISRSCRKTARCIARCNVRTRWGCFKSRAVPRWRPCPIVGKMMHPYMRRRQKKEAITYPHPSLESALKRTLGVPLFQEQLLRMAMVGANFTGAEAEELRRAVGMRRSWERMKNLEGRLRNGMTANGLNTETQETIIQNISSFALYGFPESHAASFALIAYASAYFKVKYLAAF